MLGMHIPDGFIDGPTSLLAGVVAMVLVALCLRVTARAMDEREVPVVGLVAAFVFAVQMLNFPVANGTSGHLLGGALAAVLVGPYAGALAVTVVLVVQGLLFADGGLSALGLNVINMAFVGAFGGYAVFVLVKRLLGRTPSPVTLASGIAGFAAPVLASVLFVVEYAIGGNDAVSGRAVTGSMVGVHVLIGIGEGLITAGAVGAVMAMRPDLVYGSRDVVRTRPPASTPVAGAQGVA
jgi:cobalt/nickel transport system permease protein